MNMHTVPALQRSLPEIVEEYDAKKANLEAMLKATAKAGSDLAMAVTIAGVYGDTSIDVKLPPSWALEQHLIKSAWKHVYEGLNIERLASPDDKRKWKQALEKPPEFTLDNIRGTFGKYLLDPRGNILRGLAEVFCKLDPYYKSHEKMKIGVKGLPKRVILGHFSEYGSGYGVEQVTAIINALAAYQNKPLPEHGEINLLVGRGAREDALLKAGSYKNYKGEEIEHPARGVRLRRFANGNGHLFFEPDTLKDINKALAEYYGDVLPDTSEEKPDQKQQSTAVSKDLQYYPTPEKVVDDIVADLYQPKGKLFLEPSCGCGRFLRALRKVGAKTYGVEYDAGRAAMCRAMGFQVLHGNFLETVPEPKFDGVLMNPPFYGRHYVKHVRHAIKFLKPGGVLKAILPATAAYDHGELEDLQGRYRDGFRDLPIGSFSESGTNINTVVLTYHAQTN